MSLAKRLSKGYQEIPLEISNLVGGHYPDFVTKRSVEPLEGEIPVFMFHSVKPEKFTRQMEYLAKNGYRTIRIEEFYEFLSGEKPNRRSSVLITFDDGDKSLYEVAYPILKQFGFHAVAFVVPFYIRERDETANDPSYEKWLTWPHLQEMDNSGVIDIQSHSWRHDRIFISDDLVDFYHPKLCLNPLRLDIPWTGVALDYSNNLELGTPIYTHDSRFCGNPRYIENEDLRHSCVQWVNDSGGEAFFSNPLWRKTLRSHYRKARNGRKQGRYESFREQREAILENLSQGKEILESRLKKSIRHLCYPFGTGSPLSIELSRTVGFVTNFWACLKERNTNRGGDSPYFIPRLKDDYVFRLPGEGRVPLHSVIQGKLARRLRHSHIY